MARRPMNPRDAAEAAFKSVTTKPVERAREAPAVPGRRESVTLRIDSDVVEWFQEEGPGWQDRMAAALRAAAGK
ncbi:BrnA antitoxin family protein [Aureimonas populi]|uniref:BrnA antitoxin family protein n=1 Tax=Aureimonas populi TaxID=1701758 RepID=A0ABW5CPP8_9HYPH|nr:BrnA antitoxin family protein [Aureimonas populi]